MRDDIRLVPLAKKLGWTVNLNGYDKTIEKSEWDVGDRIPTMLLSFRKGDKCLWLCKEGWRSADLPSTCNYINHKWEKDLESALKMY